MGKIIHLQFPGGKYKAFTISYDDGVESDIRLAEMMRKHGVKGTFNVNSSTILAHPEKNALRKHPVMSKERFLKFYEENRDIAEIAAHGTTHGFFPYMAQDVAAWELISDRKMIEELLGVSCRGFAYPYGKTDEKTVEALGVCGFRYARVTSRLRAFTMPQDPYRWQCTAKHTDPELMKYAEDFVSLPKKYGQSPYLFSVWGHSYEFDDEDNWDVMEKLLSFIGGRDDIWYCTNIQLFDYRTAYQRLEFFADQSRVYNPSAIPVSLAVFRGHGDWGDVTVNPGETVDLD